MLIQIGLTIIIVFVLGLAFAVTSLKLGRGDKRPGCGHHGSCSSCNPANRDAVCPSTTGEFNDNLNGRADDDSDDDDLDEDSGDGSDNSSDDESVRDSDGDSDEEPDDDEPYDSLADAYKPPSRSRT